MTNNEGAEISIRDVVFSGSAGNVQLAKATDSLNEGTLFGMVKDATIADTQSGEIYMPKRGTKVAGFTGLTVNSPIYLDRATDGGYVQSLSGFQSGDHVVTLGIVKYSTEIFWDPKYEYAYS
jgi:hypothetical protein